MNVIAVIIGDYCSEYMPAWYCWLFQVETPLLIGSAGIGLALYTWYRVRQDARGFEADYTQQYGADR